MKRSDLLIEAEELKSMLGDDNLRLFDASVLFQPASQGTAYDSYLEQHLPGAAFFDHNRVSDTGAGFMFMVPDETTLAEKLGELGIGNEHTVVFYASQQMMWATRAWWLLTYAGHTNVRVLNGTLASWDGDTEDEEHSYPPATFTTSLTPEMFASKDEVLAAMGDGGVCTMNALPKALYIGTDQVPYAKDGHISGSMSQPFEALMDGDKLKPDDELKVIFEDQIKQGKLITYCGGGIAATLNATAARLAGIPNVSVYDGSMSEWTALNLPTTKGEDP